MKDAKYYLARGNSGCELAVKLGAIAIVVDALRASTTIPMLLAHGVGRVLVIASVEDALQLSKTETDALLVGERAGERLPGFDLGNSPLEIISSPPMVGRTAIFTSSNGAQRLVACNGAARVLVGTVSNAAYIAEWTRAFSETQGIPVVLIAAGLYPDESFVSPEDDASSCYLGIRMGLPVAEESYSSFVQCERQIILEGLEGIFRRSKHAQRLMEIGYSEDVIFCARPDTIDSLPAVVGPVLLDGRQIGVEVRNISNTNNG